MLYKWKEQSGKKCVHLPTPFVGLTYYYIPYNFPGDAHDDGSRDKSGIAGRHDQLVAYEYWRVVGYPVTQFSRP